MTHETSDLIGKFFQQISQIRVVGLVFVEEKEESVLLHDVELDVVYAESWQAAAIWRSLDVILVVLHDLDLKNNEKLI